MMRPVLYLHGFASSPASAKIDLLRPLLAPHDVVLTTPDLNVPSFARLDWNALVDRAVEEGRRLRPQVIVGSSLGGLAALDVVRRGGFDVPLVLIAPALGVTDQWLARIPAGDPILVPNYAVNATLPIHRAFFEQMSRVDADAAPPRQRVVAIIGTNDESVPFARVTRTWRAWADSGALTAGSRFIEIVGGDHGLTAYVDVIAREIVAAAGG